MGAGELTLEQLMEYKQKCLSALVKNQALQDSLEEIGVKPPMMGNGPTAINTLDFIETQLNERLGAAHFQEMMTKARSVTHNESKEKV